MTTYPPGSLVATRGREWVVLPSEDLDLLRLRPLSGSEREACGVYLPLGLEQVTSATFPPPEPARAGDYESARLLWDAARLSLRSGAGPFRSLGRLSVRPRPYQFVPLLMALRLDPARILIADDVGVGKTIEAGLIARELLDRGEARRLAVVCPPYLCEQWRKELSEKFHIDAVVIRSGTAARLERQLPGPNLSLFEYYPCFIVSVDYAKSERRRHAFLLHCPDLVIVDEAHACARPPGRSRGQQQRHELLLDLVAQNDDGHILLLTATPHSGIEESFRSLLGMLDPRFARWDLHELAERQRRTLAKHFVQRRRGDVVRWMGEVTPFPERVSQEVPYTLTPAYEKLFHDVYAFAREIVHSGETLSGFRRRVRYWTALALLRCVMSSPASAQAALGGRASRLAEEWDLEADDSLFTPYVYDEVDQEVALDLSPSYVIEEGERTLAERERRRLRAFAKRAEALRGKADAKLARLADTTAGLLAEGFHPIVYCRYIATADYVAAELQRRLSSRWAGLHAVSVTGADPEDVRTAKVSDLAKADKRVLVATDCLSEGINLQEEFDAVVHYDLPWNPNRLEQREGRVDRYGQRASQVKTVLVYGQDNPVDGAVLDVLIRKAVQIRKTLGVTVPVPAESESVVEAVLRSLFLRGDAAAARQMTLFEAGLSEVEAVHRRWDLAVAREKESRTRFAQHAIKPNEVAQELEEADTVLGDPEAVERFVLAACQRLGAPLQHRGEVWKLDVQLLPEALQHRLDRRSGMSVAFTTPTPEGAEFVGRNHELTAALAEYLLDAALDVQNPTPPATRSGAIRTDVVERRTTLLLVRIRHLLQERKSAPTLAEECVVCGFEGRPGSLMWLDEERALQLLQDAQPVANVAPGERERWLEQAVAWAEELSPDLERIARGRAERLRDAHRRVRRITREGALTVDPQLPVDLLGVYVLMPVPRGVQG